MRIWLGLNCVFSQSYIKIRQYEVRHQGNIRIYVCEAGISLGTDLSRGKKLDRKCTYDVTLRRFRATIVAVGKQ